MQFNVDTSATETLARNGVVLDDRKGLSRMGVRVVRVHQGSPADRLGITAGYRVKEINGTAVLTCEDAMAQIDAAREKHEHPRFTFHRPSEIHGRTVQIRKKEGETLGIEFEEGNSVRAGVRVHGIIAGKAAASAGVLCIGDCEAMPLEPHASGERARSAHQASAPPILLQMWSPLTTSASTASIRPRS